MLFHELCVSTFQDHFRSLLTSSSAKDGYDWINPKNDSVYFPGGAQLYHVLLLRFAVPTGQEAPDWQTQFLKKYW